MLIRLRQVMALGLVMTTAWTGHAQAAAQDPVNAGQDTGGFVMKATTDLVLTNIVVRDAKTGQLIRDLKQSDFTVLENGKPQRIASFDFEDVDMAKPLNEATISGLANSIQSKAASGVRPED